MNRRTNQTGHAHAPSSRMRVLQIGKFYPPFMGGMETHLQALCGALRSSVDVSVLVANHERSRVRATEDGIDVQRMPPLMNIAGAPVCPGMAAAIRDARADLVHLHLPNPTAVISYLASGHTGPLVVTYHSDIVRQRVLGRAFEPILRRILDRAQAIIVSSPNLIESSHVLSAFRDRCQVIPFGIPLSPFERFETEEVERIRREHGPRIVMSVGRLVYYKGFEFLIQAMEAVEGKLLIVGDGPLLAELRQRAERHGVADRIAFLRNVQNIIPLYHAADVFVLASVARSEAFGLVQLEAMACGKPVVNTRLDSGVPFVSLDRVTGLTVPPADPGALAGAINLLLDDAGRRMAFGQAAQQRVRQEFTLEVMTRRTLQLYEAMMSRATSASRPARRRKRDLSSQNAGASVLTQPGG